MVKSIKSSQRSDLVGVIADNADIGLAWKKYGFEERMVNNTNAQGKVVGPSGMKIEVQRKENGEPFVRVALPATQAFIPFEAIDDTLQGLEKRMLDTNPDLVKMKFKIEKIIPKYSSNGNTKHWIVQTNVVDTIKGSHEKKEDQVKLGFVVHNGYNTGVSLGIKLFTFRLICSNGAFAKGRDLGSMNIKHVGKDPQQLLKLFQTGLMQITEDWAELMTQYKKMAATKLNEKMAQYIYNYNKKTPDKYFPDYYKIASPEQVKKGVPVIALDAKGRSVTLWENFNDMTYGLWRAKDPHKEQNAKGKEIEKKGISFKGVVKKELKLQNAMSFIIEHPEKFV